MPINILPALKKNKTNKTFMVLSALGILFVLDDHAGSKIGVLTNIFPYNSFYMPMFVFISGYFFKEGNIKQTGTFILKKIKTLLIPWLLYNFFYLAVSIIIVYFFKLNWQLQIDKLLKHTWLFGTPVDICNPGWFVIMLFEVCCIYIIVRRLLGKIWNDYIALLILALIGMISVYFCHRGGYREGFLPFLKIGFFIQFYHLGYCYKRYFETIVCKVSGMFIIVATVLINLVLISIYGDRVNFNSCAFMQGFLADNYLLPLITSVTGILFWITCSKKIAISLADNRFVNFISENTFYIMINHLFIYNLLNIIFWKLNSPGFDLSRFQINAWYQYIPVPQFGVFYVITAIFILYCIKSIWLKIQKDMQ